MRDGASGRYTISPSGYQVCMLDRENMRGYYRDPYLLAMVKQSNVDNDRIADPWPWFSGCENKDRILTLSESNTKIQCQDQGWKVESPDDPDKKVIFDRICLDHPVKENLLTVRQCNGVDTEDRIILGAKFLSDLVDAGL